MGDDKKPDNIPTPAFITDDQWAEQKQKVDDLESENVGIREILIKISTKMDEFLELKATVKAQTDIIASIQKAQIDFANQVERRLDKMQVEIDQNKGKHDEAAEERKGQKALINKVIGGVLILLIAGFLIFIGSYAYKGIINEAIKSHNQTNSQPAKTNPTP